MTFSIFLKRDLFWLYGPTILPSYSILKAVNPFFAFAPHPFPLVILRRFRLLMLAKYLSSFSWPLQSGKIDVKVVVVYLWKSMAIILMEPFLLSLIWVRTEELSIYILSPFHSHHYPPLWELLMTNRITFLTWVNIKEEVTKFFSISIKLSRILLHVQIFSSSHEPLYTCVFTL